MIVLSRLLRGSRVFGLGTLVVLTAVATAAVPQRPDGDVLIFAAASLQTALDELAPATARATGSRVRASYAASSALARQIEYGAPADLFISADLEWMEYVSERRLIQPASRINLLGNRLVLIAPTDRPSALKIAPGFPLAAALVEIGWPWPTPRRCRPASTRAPH